MLYIKLKYKLKVIFYNYLFCIYLEIYIICSWFVNDDIFRIKIVLYIFGEKIYICIIDWWFIKVCI